MFFLGEWDGKDGDAEGSSAGYLKLVFLGCMAGRGCAMLCEVLRGHGSSFPSFDLLM
jgi:hypothetical protein